MIGSVPTACRNGESVISVGTKSSPVFSRKRSAMEPCSIIIEVDNDRIKVEKCTPVVNILEEDGEEGFNVVLDGTFGSPILVDSHKRPHQGSQEQPISLDEKDDEEVEIIETRSSSRKFQGSNNKNPICVENYQVMDEEDVMYRVAIAESLAYLDDPKGKKPMRGFTEILDVDKDTCVKEIGESSKPPPKEPDMYCNICMEPKFKHECFYMEGCSHYYCASCVSLYVEAKIEDNVTSIRCPDTTCKSGFLDIQMCQTILKPAVFARWGTALCEAMIGAMKFYCPFKDCSALLIDEGELITEAECPHCSRLFCARCKVPWHVISCEEYQKLGVDERTKEDIMLREMAKSCQWQRCPKCNFYVERISGCMFMSCRCGHKFCYGCATTMTIDHYCQKCRR